MNERIKKAITHPIFIGVCIILLLLSGIVNGLFSYQASAFKTTVDQLEQSNRILQENNNKLEGLNDDNLETVGRLRARLTRATIEANRGEQLIVDLTTTINGAGDTVQDIINTVQELIDTIQSYTSGSGSLGIRTGD